MYPAEHAERPLLLPAGAIEGGALLEMQDVDFDSDGFQTYLLTPGVRYGLTNAEVEARVALAVYNDTPDGVTIQDNALRSFDLAGRLGLGENAIAGLELSLLNPGEDFASYATRAVLAHKRRYGAASLEAAVLAGYTFAGDNGIDAINLGGRLAATAQVSPVVAIQGRAELGWFDYTDTPMGFPEYGWFFNQNYGVHAFVALNPSTDLVAGFDQLSSGEYGARLYTVGVAMRRVP